MLLPATSYKNTLGNMKSKRQAATLIPYKIQGGKILIYFQKKAKDAPRWPDYFGFFGGGLEGKETPEEALRREIKEELDFAPEGYEFLGKYEFPNHINHMFALQVGEDFEKQVTVFEGDYGIFFDEREALREPMLIDEDKEVLRDFYKKIKTRNEK